MAAKNPAKGQFKKARRNINRLERALQRGREKDYRTAQDQLDAIYGNLGKAIKGQGGLLAAANRRIMRRMNFIANRKNPRLARAVNAEARAAGQGSGLLADTVSAAFAPARAERRGGAAVQRAQVEEARGRVDTAQDLLGMAEAGAAEAEAGAQAATAQALEARTKEDVMQVAQMRQELTLARLQYQLEIARMEKQAQLARRQARFEKNLLEKDGTASGYDLSQIGQGLTTASAFARSYLEENPDATPDEIIDHLVTEGRVPEGARDDPVLKVLVERLKSSSLWGPNQIGGREGRKMEIALIMDVVKSFYDQYNQKDYSKLNSFVQAQLKALYSTAEAAAANAAATSNSTGSFNVYDQPDPETGGRLSDYS